MGRVKLHSPGCDVELLEVLMEGCETCSALPGLRTLPVESTVCYRVQEAPVDRSSLKPSV